MWEVETSLRSSAEEIKKSWNKPESLDSTAGAEITCSLNEVGEKKGERSCF